MKFRKASLIYVFLSLGATVMLPMAMSRESSPITPNAANTPVPSAPNSTPTCLCADALPDMVERVSPGVVNISSTTLLHVPRMDDFFLYWGLPQTKKQTSLGSGFMIDEEGFILTNNHVVEQATEVSITLEDKRQFRAKIIGTDPKMDLALLQIRDSDGKVPKGMKFVLLGDSDTVRNAETVVAIGNPFGLQNTVTKGIISAKNRTIGLGPFDNFLQTDASINPGNSGGPLFNLQGMVIGVTTAIRSNTGQSGGLGFAIPINEAKRLIPDLKRYGRVPWPWLGILPERMSPQLQHYYQLAVGQGVLIDSIVQGGPADFAGLQQGDILTHIEDVAVLEPNDIEKALRNHKPKDTIRLKFYRGKRIRELVIKLQELPKVDHIPKGII